MVSFGGFNIFNCVFGIFILWATVWFYWNIAKKGFQIIRFIFRKLGEPTKPLVAVERIFKLP